MDKVEDKEKIVYLKKKYPKAILVSAKEHIMIDSLIEKIKLLTKKNSTSQLIKIPHKDAFLLKDIYGKFEVESRKDTYECIELKISGNSLELKKINKRLKQR